MNMALRYKLMREGSQVKRLHALTIRNEYLVGQHSFNMLCLLRLLWPEASSRLIWAILEHDLPERWTGDMPAPAKWYGVMDKERTREMDAEYARFTYGEESVHQLSILETKWLVGLDMLEFYCFCRDELMHGNLTILGKMKAVEELIPNKRAHYPPRVIDMFYEIKRSEWETFPDTPENL